MADMRTKKTWVFILILAGIICAAFRKQDESLEYLSNYNEQIGRFTEQQAVLLKLIEQSDLQSETEREKIKQQIAAAREHLKIADFWLRYLEPVSYKKINGPLPVEWETEVFEKFEKPYKREGAGLTLAELYLEEPAVNKDHLAGLVLSSINALKVYQADSVTADLWDYHHFYLCNRLFLLNLAAIYTTGFECPDTSRIIPELRAMIRGVKKIYVAFNSSFPSTPLPLAYLDLYENMLLFCNAESASYTRFDHFTFIRDFVNPLFALNQNLIREYGVITRSYVDYSLTKTSNSIFSKTLYNGQNAKGVFLRLKDKEMLEELDKTGKLLFYDPILSGNNQRSCASCHSGTQYFTDTSASTSFQFDHKNFLARNTPSLINVGFNHLVMQDGKHISLQHQAKAVITNATELGSDEKEVVKKVLSCADYKRTFTKLLKYTPQETEITIDHIVSAITFYYSKFSGYYSPFDEAMNERKPVNDEVKEGFNIFMGKAQCATCHFVPQFNGVKPPFVSSEFEVIGVPADTSFRMLSPDQGRFVVNPAEETLHAFRTGSLRNASHTSPYMHNGAFSALSQVINFYDAGGGAGRGLDVTNQTLSSDSLHLTQGEKNKLLSFIRSLDENISFEYPPEKLPVSHVKALNNRRPDGIY